MSHPFEMPSARPDSVRTLLVGSQPCPVCGIRELRGRQTACSAACRRERSRWRQVTRLRETVLLMRAQLEDLLDLVEKLPGGRRRWK